MNDRAEEARTRQGLYRFASAALRAPEQSTWAQLGPAAELLRSRDIARFAFAPEWRRFTDSLFQAISRDEIESEYVRLFGVGPASTPAPPAESSYRVPERDGATGEFVASIQAEYRQLGIPSMDSGEPPDHIATELEAMSYLCRTEADAWEADNVIDGIRAVKLQRGFLDRHLAVWVPSFATNARKARPSTFYSSLINFVHAFVVNERNLATLRVESVQAS